MKILLCFGTRPEAIKMAPLYLELIKNTAFQVKLCVTAQHRKMLDQVMRFFEIVPDYDLNLMTENQTLNHLSASILLEFDKILSKENPDLVLIHGDTTTSSMVAIASFHRNIKVGHVEAGLRTYNKLAPYPEEINRQITGKIADYHFTPTVSSKNNLINERVSHENVLITGNTVIDALLWTKDKLDTGYTNEQMKALQSFEKKKFILVTGHRRENFGHGYKAFCEALLAIVNQNEVDILFPVHLNPNVQEPVYKILGENKNIHLLEPVEYPVMVWLMEKCCFIISDSGGIQEEAPTFHKHVLVTREVSERPEGLENGFSTLVGTNKNVIIEKANFLLKNGFQSNSKNPYGDGLACKKIVEYLSKLNL